MQTDTLFAGPVPQLYDRHLGPWMFEPFAQAIAQRLTGVERDVLETAAGTGVVTRAVLAALPEAHLTATDLNGAMLDVARQRNPGDRVRWQQADAQVLPFPDHAFDLVVCSFGVMFMPDKPAAYREARRVLRPGGRFLFTVWGQLDANPLSHIVNDTVAAMFPEDPPQFMARIPFGHGDKDRLKADLRAAGFASVAIEEVSCESDVASADGPATGLTQGTPLRGEIESRDPSRLLEASNASADALRQRFGDGAFRAPLRALIVTASG
jgi:ubiquinone/menaquinone biosynthesis C-methylase UbiE